MRRIIILIIGLLSYCHIAAQHIQDSVRINFRSGKANLDMDLGENRKVLEDIKEKLQLNANDSVYYRLHKVLVVGGASPEGSIALNKRLSEKRAETLFNYLAQYATFPDSLKTTHFLGRDWQGLVRLVEADSAVPYQQESLELLREIIREVASGTKTKTDPFWRLVSFRGGKPYRYMYYHLFPELRASRVYLWFKEIPKPVMSEQASFQRPMPPVQQLPSAPLTILEPPLYWALKTNLLYDALLVPNIGVELYLGKNWSVDANWMYAWWKNDVNRRWRVYGGDLGVRYWFGSQVEAKPLTGHHVGVYAQMLTYDFCLKEKGYMGGKPRGNIWDKLHYAFGVEYGYSLPIARRLNLDFSLGLGYMGGTYHEYQVMDDCKVWQATKNRRWWGPTKAEVSLVWLLGKTNYNKEKGGTR